METKSLVQTAVAVLVAVVVFTTVLIPITTSAQEIAGDPITFTNPTQIVMREIHDGDVLTVERTETDDIWRLNGEIISNVAATGTISWNTAVISDGVYVRANAHSNSAIGEVYDMTLETLVLRYISSATVFSATFSDGSVTVTGLSLAEGSNTLTAPYTWGYIVCNLGEGEYTATVSTGSVLSNVKDGGFMLGGVYTTGNNKTAYTYHDGVLNIVNPAYNGSVSTVSDLHEGTTDVYDVDVTVNIGDESFTPYRILVPYEIHGHKDSGASYTLVGIIPLLVIVGLILAVVGFAIARRYDL